MNIWHSDNLVRMASRRAGRPIIRGSDLAVQVDFSFLTRNQKKNLAATIRRGYTDETSTVATAFNVMRLALGIEWLVTYHNDRMVYTWTLHPNEDFIEHVILNNRLLNNPHTTGRNNRAFYGRWMKRIAFAPLVTRYLWTKDDAEAMFAVVDRKFIYRVNHTGASIEHRVGEWANSEVTVELVP